ncbi:probable serine/threonine-protein kinase PBL23 isoform X2 [Glycine soja]|uniref:Serine/threonine-protein kinase PBS1 isoform B n=1 Tax=Glycine soja TaxID=3848 RepID=A0A445IBY2_GLYSO|nr:probable serine/threonine-protein kinase PBL23 isoform X2 [Glycine soja]KHN36705.1 Serine/threonine-protein kinase PBS1 [Glycine soja]RZB83405.1 Serine/threonine-protein kinase PBS1 isoform B [Glycine soja]
MEEDYGYRRTAKIALVAIMVLASVAVFALLVVFAYYCYILNKVSNRRKSLKKVEDANLNEKSDFANLQVVAEKGLQVFTFKQLHSATGGFSKSNVIGHGGFGLVYRGVLNDGRKVAIKFMDQAGKQGEEEFKVEVELLTRLHSPYLLALLGYCSDSNHKLLVYEFMANGGLQEHLYPVSNSIITPVKLDWETRLRIALEAAKGLEYLHEHVSPPVIHRDFKSSNILLDKKFHAKVSDFGLAKLGPDRAGGHVSTRVLGTQGYVAPEYALTGHLTTKSDVYSYGVVLLELLTGRVPVDMKRPPGEGVLVSWALPLLTDREKVVKIMDPSLEGQYSMKEVVQVAAIAAMCVQPEADYRPLMADVVQSLVPLVKTQRSPSKVGSCSSFNSPKLSPGPTF